MFVKIFVARVLMTLLFYIDMTSPDKIEIARFLPEGKLSKWKDGVDSFTIPRSACEQTGGRQFVDDCNTLCPTYSTVDTSRQYSCVCQKPSATLTYLNNTWRCLANKDVRNQLGTGCEENNLFTKEDNGDRLRILNTFRGRKTELQSRNCSFNFNYSWYINCYGERIPLKQISTSFNLVWKSSKTAYFIKVLNDSSLRGRIVNLGVKCPVSGGHEYGCLLFKVEGNYSCPLEKPPTHGFQSSSIGPTYTVTPSVSKTTTYLTATASAVLPSAAAPPTTGSTKTQTKQNAGITKEKLKSDDASSSSSLGLIAGVTASAAAVLLIMVVVVICRRRRKSRKGAQASTKKTESEGNAYQNVAFQPEVQNGYQTNTHKKPGPSCVQDDYAALNVPEGHNIYGPGNVDEPFYNVLQEPALEKEEDGQHYGSLSLDPAMYHTLEELPGEEQKDSEYSYLTEPTYNVLEGPVPEGRGETGSHGATSVNEPFYNTLEEPVSNEAHPSNNHDSVYNTLEDPLSYDPEPRTLQDHVYNVLEGPSANGNVNKDNKIPVYAVVNKRKKN